MEAQMMDNAKWEADLAKAHAEIGKLIAETGRLNAETAKISREARWYPAIALAAFVGAAAAVGKLFLS